MSYNYFIYGQSTLSPGLCILWFQWKFRIPIQMVTIGLAKPNITLALEKAAITPGIREFRFPWQQLCSTNWVVVLMKGNPLEENRLSTHRTEISVFNPGLENNKTDNIEISLLRSLCFIFFLYRLTKTIISLWAENLFIRNWTEIRPTGGQ